MATTKKVSATKRVVAAPPVMGSLAAARPQAKPLPKPPAGAAATPKRHAIQQIDPLFTYDIRVFDGTSWLKLGEVWFNPSGTEYWGLYQAWSTYNVGPNCWIYPIAYATTYSSLTVFKAKLTADDPSGNPSFLKISSSPA
jgi:hypothetical protein